MSRRLHFFLSHRRFALLLVLAAWLLAGAKEASAIGTFHMVTVGVIPYGEGLNQIALATDCEECSGDLACSFIPFAGSDSLIYIYNIGFNTLSAVRLSGDSIASVTTMPGPDLDGSQVSIEDGCATADGTIYLVTDNGSLDGGRYQVFMRAPATGQWTSSDPIPDNSDMGWAQVMGARVQLSGGTRIAEELNAPGTIAVYSMDRHENPAIVVAESGTLLPAAARTLLAPGIRSPAGVTALRAPGRNQPLLLARGAGDTTIVDSRKAGLLLGLDSTGRSYSLVYHPEEGLTPQGTWFAYFECFTSSGQLIASRLRPFGPPLIRSMLGKRFVFVPGSTIFDIDALESGIRIDRWTLGE